MAATTATSKVSMVQTGSGGRMKSTTYISTKVTGPDNNGNFTSEIVQSDNASGAGAKTIGSRDADGNITWNNNASGRTKLNESKFKKASNNQISSLQNELATSAKDKEGLNKASGKKNQDNTDGNTDSSQSKPTPKPTNKNDGLSGEGEPTAKARNSYPKNLCYPIAMRSNLKDNVQINVIKHTPKALDKDTGLNFKNRPKGPTIGSVILPMPSAIGDGNKTSWGNGTMTPTQLAASGAVKAFLGDEGGGGAATSISNSLGQFQEDGGETILENFFTEQLTGAEDLLSRTTGSIQNPNMELLFKGPDMRSFSFSWKMSPRYEKESIEIAKIIRMFKQSMAPQKTSEGLFLKAPSIYDIKFRSGKDLNKFLPKIKTCALTDCSVNYTPDGSFMAYDNDAMVSLELSLSFQEMDPIYNNDMGETDDSIGY